MDCCTISPFSKVEDDGSHTRKNEEEEEESFWNAMLRADKKDYERICNEFGVADLHLALRRLEVKRRERAQKVELARCSTVQH